MLVNDGNDVRSQFVDYDIHGVLEAPVPGGRQPLDFSLDDLDKVSSDPIGFAAKHFSMSRDEYIRWIEQDGASQCVGVTQQGKRCKKRSEIQLNAEEWLELERTGFRCHVH